MMKLSCTILITLVFVGTVRASEQDAALAKGRTLLMVDDHDILYRSGTNRVLNPAQRHSDRPLIAMDKKWEVGIAWTSAYRNPNTGKYQLWYQAYAGGRAGDKRLKCVVCYAESDDGITFTKPELDLFPYSDELKKTNIVQKCHFARVSLSCLVRSCSALFSLSVLPRSSVMDAARNSTG